MRRIGAAQFQRGRRAVGFGIAGIGGQSGRDLVGAADDRIEARVGIVAVQRGADLVLQADIGDVEAAAAGDRERIGDVEGVERIKPGILVGGAQRDRADRDGIAGLAEKYSAAADDKVRTDGAELGAGREVGDAGIETGADHEMIVVAEQLVGIGRLQRHARRGRMGRGSVALAQHGCWDRRDWRAGRRSGRWPACCRRRSKAASGRPRRAGCRSGCRPASSDRRSRTCAEPSIVQVGVASTFPVRLT